MAAEKASNVVWCPDAIHTPGMDLDAFSVLLQVPVPPPPGDVTEFCKLGRPIFLAFPAALFLWVLIGTCGICVPAGLRAIRLGALGN